MQARRRPEHQCSVIYGATYNAVLWWRGGTMKDQLWGRRQVLSEGRTCPEDPPGVLCGTAYAAFVHNTTT